MLLATKFWFDCLKQVKESPGNKHTRLNITSVLSKERAKERKWEALEGSSTSSTNLQYSGKITGCVQIVVLCYVLRELSVQLVYE